ncbi:RNA-binding protein [Flavobacterium branchiophilum]|uniref:Uncharacterized protein DUF721 n=1 Tax=Flavobacterium branchiophilum TaxID=55197 RepID=A0A543G705_9FLAO|nr:DUF721 domain-containing protein [Flavobacterium branchiophilum]OXA81761.1 RNA-binding protein [Flavobacterium branchiophilum] [Flavobacterium branchiophilum NBRC 15030 = ATCC 35035]TQM41871.1 uncharacterized protein DUF721 [Flavobacterium branchiophilum]GEM54367.1 hypothetical protein FB1_05880 [Flavobacterium branchiophilum NBRC 15030 = ATCC 35035]
MNKRTSNEECLADVIKEIIKKNKLQSGIDDVNVREAWKNIMGNGVNAYTEDVILKSGKLYVKLSSSTLRAELSYGKDKIITLLNEALRREVVQEVILR